MDGYQSGPSEAREGIDPEVTAKARRSFSPAYKTRRSIGRLATPSLLLSIANGDVEFP